MTLNSSGPISLGGSTVGQSVNLELGFSATATIAMNTTAVRTLAGFPTAGTQYSMSNFYGKSNRVAISYTFTTSTVNASLNINTLGGYSAGTTDITVTNNSGVYLWANSTGSYGLNLTGATTGDTVTLVNNGYIMGQGGNGGPYNGGPSAGGPALNVGIGVNITVTNTSGWIGGGGGGGSQNNGVLVGGGAGGGGGNGGSSYDSEGGSVGPGGTGGGIGSVGGNPGSMQSGFGGGRIMPGTTGSNESGGNGGNVCGNGQGGGGGIAGQSGTSPWPYGGGGGGGYGASGGPASTGGAAGGKAVNLNAKTITWTGGSASSSRAFGAVS